VSGNQNPGSEKRHRVLLLASACNPYKGSDSAAGWGRVLETAKRFDTWVITGHWAQEDIGHYLDQHGEIPGLHLYFLKKSWIEDLLMQGKPLYDIHYLPYHLWHWRAFKLAAHLHRELKFDLCHLVTRVGYREPGYLWRLNAPYVWGPVGGTQNYPWRFLRAAGVAGALQEGLRSVINLLQFRFSPRVRKAASNAVVLITANSQIYRDFERVHGIRGTVLLETGLFSVESVESREAKNATDDTPLRILWSGQLIHRKALHLLLRALAGLPACSKYTLKILGNGPLKKRWQKLAKQLEIDRHCCWLGWVPYGEALKEYHWADVLVFTSLRDTSGNVVLEALGRGVPVICLDHQGVADIVTSSCGTKIPVTNPEEVIAGLREAIAAFDRDRDSLRQLVVGAQERARVFLWNRNGEKMANIYAAIWEKRLKRDS
jgi:glycosyltransferase involved in cell wall biosynthesis